MNGKLFGCIFMSRGMFLLYCICFFMQRLLGLFVSVYNVLIKCLHPPNNFYPPNNNKKELHFDHTHI